MWTPGHAWSALGHALHLTTLNFWFKGALLHWNNFFHNVCICLHFKAKVLFVCCLVNCKCPPKSLPFLMTRCCNWRSCLRSEPSRLQKTVFSLSSWRSSKVQNRSNWYTAPTTVSTCSACNSQLSTYDIIWMLGVCSSMYLCMMILVIIIPATDSPQPSASPVVLSKPGPYDCLITKCLSNIHNMLVQGLMSFSLTPKRTAAARIGIRGKQLNAFTMSAIAPTIGRPSHWCISTFNCNWYHIAVADFPTALP